MYSYLGKKSLHNHLEDAINNPANKEKEIKELEEALFGDESNLLGRTITGEAVGFTTSKIKES